MPDLFGHAAERAPFVDIKNQRPGVAEEKAALCMELNKLLQTPPRSLGSASIQLVRRWRFEHKAALAILKSKDSSRGQLQAAINTMRSFE